MRSSACSPTSSTTATSRATSRTSTASSSSPRTRPSRCSATSTAIDVAMCSAARSGGRGACGAPGATPRPQLVQRPGQTAGSREARPGSREIAAPRPAYSVHGARRLKPYTPSTKGEEGTRVRRDDVIINQQRGRVAACTPSANERAPPKSGHGRQNT
eukprot:575058-Prymnesium_polylepis.1